MIMVVGLGVILGAILFVAMLTVHNVRRDELMQDPRNNLNAHHASNEAGDENPRGSFGRKAAIL